MRGLVGIDAGVLDHCFRRVGARKGRGLARFFARVAKKRGAVEEQIQVATAGDFDARDALGRLERIGDFLRQGAGRFFQALGQLEADGRGDFAHGELRRTLGHDRDIGLVALVNVVAQRFADAVVDGLIHVAPWVK